MEEKVKKELSNFSRKDFIHFYKFKEGWFYFFSNLIEDNTTYDKKREDLFYKRSTFDYSLGDKLYKEINLNSEYSGVAHIYTKPVGKAPVGVVYSKKYSTINEVFNNDLKKLLKLIKKENVNISTNQTFESLDKNIDLIESIILKNELNVNLERLANKKLSPKSIDLIEEYYKIVFLKLSELIKEL